MSDPGGKTDEPEAIQEATNARVRGDREASAIGDSTEEPSSPDAESEDPRWPGGVLRFMLKAGLDPLIQAAARGARDHYNQFTAETGVRVEEVPSTYTGDYVLVVDANDPFDPPIAECGPGVPCSQFIGYLGGVQRVWLNIKNGESYKMVAVHEFGHALGRHHEHQRCSADPINDRDTYIDVKSLAAVGTKDCSRSPPEPYDVYSVMHYSDGEFGTNAIFRARDNDGNGIVEMVLGKDLPLRKSTHAGLSPSDRRALARMYGASTFSLVSLMHGRCLDAPSNVNGTRVHMWDCQPGNANQRWKYDPATGEVRIHGNKCLDAWGAKRLDPIVVHDCHGGANQKWDITLPGRVMLRGIKDEYGRSMCIDIAYLNRDLGAQLLLQYCHRGDNQAWRRSDSGLGGATVNIESDIGRCLDSPGSTTGTALHLWDCSSTNANQRATRTVAGEVRIHNKCLDGQTLQPGMPLILWDCHGGANQKWNRDLKGRLVSASNPAVCVDVWGASSYNGAPLKLYSCHDGTNQKWSYNHIAYP